MGVFESKPSTTASFNFSQHLVDGRSRTIERRHPRYWIRVARFALPQRLLQCTANPFALGNKAALRSLADLCIEFRRNEHVETMAHVSMLKNSTAYQRNSETRCTQRRPRPVFLAVRSTANFERLL